MNIMPYLSLLLINILKNNSFKQAKHIRHFHINTNRNISPFIYYLKNLYNIKKGTEYYYEEDPNDNYSHLNKKTRKISLTNYEPKTENQRKYVELLNNKNNTLIVAVGSAGSGKTMYACLKAVELLKNKQTRKIIITRPVVSVEEDIGFLPGTIESKMDPYMRPIFDIFTEFFSVSEWNDMIFSRVIEISPLAYMRGRTFKNSFIIADEMQNSSPNQMKMLLTRIGSNSRMVLTGDLSQTDKVEENGLNEFIGKLEKYPKKLVEKSNISIVYLNKTDIQRNPLVESILNIYDYKKPRSIEKNQTNYVEKKSNISQMLDTNIIIYKNNDNQSIIQNFVNITMNECVSNVSDVSNTDKYENKRVDNDCALMPKKDIPKLDFLKNRSLNFRDWSREIGI